MITGTRSCITDVADSLLLGSKGEGSPQGHGDKSWADTVEDDMLIECH